VIRRRRQWPSKPRSPDQLRVGAHVLPRGPGGAIHWDTASYHCPTMWSSINVFKTSSPSSWSLFFVRHVPVQSSFRCLVQSLNYCSTMLLQLVRGSTFNITMGTFLYIKHYSTGPLQAPPCPRITSHGRELSLLGHRVREIAPAEPLHLPCLLRV